MQTEEFLKRVQVRACLENQDQARLATEIVFDTMRARISHAGGDNVAAQLPKELKDMWESGTLEHLLRSIRGAEHLTLDEFLGRIADKTHTDRRCAETITCGVFTTMREQITEGADHAVQNQLPNDIKDFWLSCTPKAGEEAGGAVAERPASHEAEAEIIRILVSKEEYPEPMGVETGQPMGMQEEMIEALTEAQVREMRGETTMHKPEEEEGHEPPAAERVEMVAPPGKHDATEGPGSETHYRSDVELTQEIESMLNESEELDAEHIDVFVQAGNVILRGHVMSDQARDMASHITAKALGVGDIRNELEIQK